MPKVFEAQLFNASQMCFELQIFDASHLCFEDQKNNASREMRGIRMARAIYASGGDTKNPCLMIYLIIVNSFFGKIIKSFIF